MAHKLDAASSAERHSVQIFCLCNTYLLTLCTFFQKEGKLSVFLPYREDTGSFRGL